MKSTHEYPLRAGVTSSNRINIHMWIKRSLTMHAILTLASPLALNFLLMEGTSCYFLPVLFVGRVQRQGGETNEFRQNREYDEKAIQSLQVNSVVKRRGLLFYSEQRVHFYEAEENMKLYRSKVGKTVKGFTGSGYINLRLRSRGAVEWNDIEVSTSGRYDIHFHYSLKGDGRECKMRMNDSSWISIAFAGSDDWEDWRTVKVGGVAMKTEEKNKLLIFCPESKGPNLDRFSVTLVEADTSPPTSRPSDLDTSAPSYEPSGRTTVSDTSLPSAQQESYSVPPTRSPSENQIFTRAGSITFSPTFSTSASVLTPASTKLNSPPHALSQKLTAVPTSMAPKLTSSTSTSAEESTSTTGTLGPEIVSSTSVVVSELTSSTRTMTPALTSTTRTKMPALKSIPRSAPGSRFHHLASHRPTSLVESSVNPTTLSSGERMKEMSFLPPSLSVKASPELRTIPSTMSTHPTSSFLIASQETSSPRSTSLPVFVSPTSTWTESTSFLKTLRPRLKSLQPNIQDVSTFNTPEVDSRVKDTGPSTPTAEDLSKENMTMITQKPTTVGIIQVTETSPVAPTGKSVPLNFRLGLRFGKPDGGGTRLSQAEEERLTDHTKDYIQNRMEQILKRLVYVDLAMVDGVRDRRTAEDEARKTNYYNVSRAFAGYVIFSPSPEPVDSVDVISFVKKTFSDASASEFVRRVVTAEHAAGSKEVGVLKYLAFVEVAVDESVLVDVPAEETSPREETRLPVVNRVRGSDSRTRDSDESQSQQRAVWKIVLVSVSSFVGILILGCVLITLWVRRKGTRKVEDHQELGFSAIMRDVIPNWTFSLDDQSAFTPSVLSKETSLAKMRRGRSTRRQH